MGWIGDLLNDVAQGDYLFVVALCILLSYASWRLYYRIRGAGVKRIYPRFFGLSFQIGMTLMLERLYEFSRAHVAVDQLSSLAYANAYRVVDFEIAHGIFFEQRLQSLFWPDQWLMHAIDAFYGFAHLFVTLGFLIWLYLRRNRVFSFVRNLFYLATGITLIVYMVYPTSPPRMFTNLGFIDTAKIIGSAASSTQVTQYTYNPFAAMPSLHMVYALIVGGTLAIVGRRLWLRVAGVIYPFVMLAVVLISANHWILDAVGAAIVVAGSVVILAGAGKATDIARSLMGERQRLSSA